MKPCYLCGHIPFVDSTPDCNGWDTFCSNCDAKLWDVTTAPVIVNRPAAAKQRDIWSALAVLCIPIAHVDPAITELYHEAKEQAEAYSELAQDASYDDSELTRLLEELRNALRD